MEMRDMAEERVGRVKRERESYAVERRWGYGSDCAFKRDLDRKTA
jgi:hypothetical protein